MLALMILFQIPAFAAAPVFHAYCTQEYFKTVKYTQKEQDAFMRGTLFPDIRYLARIPREKTHKKKVVLKKIRAMKNAFEAGVAFHSYVDIEREKVAKRCKAYAKVSLIPSQYQGHFLKVVEDQLCYEKINVPSVLRALKRVDKETERYKIPYYTVRAWHRNLNDYFKQSPLQLFKDRSSKKKGYFKMPAIMVTQWSKLVERFSHNKEIICYVDELRNQFEKLLRQ